MRTDRLTQDPGGVARALAWMRIGIGVTMILAPRTASRAWIRGGDASAASRAALRGLGGRDIALGTGLLRALDGDGPARTWLEAGAVADASDALSTLLSFRSLPKLRALGVIASAAGAAAVGARLASLVDDA